MGTFKNARKKYQYPTEVLEAITKYLDTKTCLNMLLLCEEVNSQLIYSSPAFWKHLCSMENFLEITSLKNEETEGEDASKRLSWLDLVLVP